MWTGTRWFCIRGARSREHWDDWSIYSMGIIGDHVEARLARILPGIAADQR